MDKKQQLNEIHNVGKSIATSRFAGNRYFVSLWGTHDGDALKCAYDAPHEITNLVYSTPVLIIPILVKYAIHTTCLVQILRVPSLRELGIFVRLSPYELRLESQRGTMWTILKSLPCVDCLQHISLGFSATSQTAIPFCPWALGWYNNSVRLSANPWLTSKANKLNEIHKWIFKEFV